MEVVQTKAQAVAMGGEAKKDAYIPKPSSKADAESGYMSGGGRLKAVAHL